MGTRALPDMYALSPWACGPQASGIQAIETKRLCLYYNLYMYISPIYNKKVNIDHYSYII